jgi:hypothetical protein
LKALIRLCTVALSFLALPANASATGVTYDCDTAADHFSELVLPAESGSFTVSGNVQLNALAGSATYTAIARIQIASSAAPGHSPNAFAGFSLSALPADPKKTPTGSPAIQMLSWNLSGKDNEVLPLSMLTKPGTVQHFSVSYDGTNVSVDLGKESKSFPIALSEPVVRIVCSTGEFLFTDVVIAAKR